MLQLRQMLLRWIFNHLLGFAYGTQVPDAVARRESKPVVTQKANAPIDLDIQRAANRRRGNQKRRRLQKLKKRAQRFGIQTIPTKSSGDDLVPKSSFNKGVNL